MDDEMNPEARRIIELTRAARTPRTEDKERVRRALAAGLVAAAVSTPGIAAGATAAKAGTAGAAAKLAGAGAAAGIKLALSVVLIASVGAGAYWLTRDRQPPAPVIAPAPVETAVIAEPPVAVAVPPAAAQVAGAEAAAEVEDAPSALPARDPLLAEAALLNKAQQAWRVGNARRALELAQKHAQRYPRSALAFERDAVRVLALCALGRKAQARPLAAALVKRAPRSPLRTSVEESCGMR